MKNLKWMCEKKDGCNDSYNTTIWAVSERRLSFRERLLGHLNEKKNESGLSAWLLRWNIFFSRCYYISIWLSYFYLFVSSYTNILLFSLWKKMFLFLEFINYFLECFVFLVGMYWFIVRSWSDRGVSIAKGRFWLKILPLNTKK